LAEASQFYPGSDTFKDTPIIGDGN
jgi:hypothetical protein